MSTSQSIHKWAKYKGFEVFVGTRKDRFYFVQIEGQYPPEDLLIDMHKTGLAEYEGRIPVNAPDLKFIEERTIPHNQAL